MHRTQDKDAKARQLPTGPIDHYLAALYARIAGINDGQVATYIPELAKVDPSLFGIVIATVDGKIYTAGDYDHPFTIQSISKAFIYGHILSQYGRDAVLERVGVEPTGEAFNSIVLDEEQNRPYNPMVNSGAIVAAEMIPGATTTARIANMLNVFSTFAGRPLSIDDNTFRSEQATGHRNRAIAHMMLNSGMIRSAPEEILDVYFRQCSVEVTCRDLAVMAATLANDGVNPLTGDVAMPRDYVHDVLTVMNSCGMYNFAGQWSYEVGMPAKSGVGGGIIAVIPGQVGIGVFSPPLDRHGHSVRGVRVCREISETFGLHVFRNHTFTGTVIRRELRGDVVRSKRMRDADDSEILDRIGSEICLVEVQGGLFFGSAERLVRRLDELATEASLLILDLTRVHEVDHAARLLIMELIASLSERGRRLLFVDVTPDGSLAELHAVLAQHFGDLSEIVFAHRDTALEYCETRLIAHTATGRDHTKFSLGSLDLFNGLTPDELKIIETTVRPIIFEKGQKIVSEGDEAHLFFIIARGSATVSLRVRNGGVERVVRVATLGPGLSFGEMALLDGGKRSADVTADERVICYGFSVEQLREIGGEHPRIYTTILGNMMRDFSERLRRANDEIRALEG
jgi:glutaminase